MRQQTAHAHAPAVGQITDRAVVKARTIAVVHGDAAHPKRLRGGVQVGDHLAQVHTVVERVVVAAQIDRRGDQLAARTAAAHLDAGAEQDAAAAVDEVGAAGINVDAVDGKSRDAGQRGDQAFDFGVITVQHPARFDGDCRHRPAAGHLGGADGHAHQLAVGQARRHAGRCEIEALCADTQAGRRRGQFAHQAAHAVGGRRGAAAFDARGHIAIDQGPGVDEAMHLDDVAGNQRRRAAGHAIDDSGRGHAHDLAEHRNQQASRIGVGDRAEQVARKAHA